MITTIPLDKENRMLRIGLGKHEGKWFFRIDLWRMGFRLKRKERKPFEIPNYPGEIPPPPPRKLFNEDPIIVQFRNECKDWLEPLGYKFIWAINHPNQIRDEVHYCKGRVRVCCFIDHSERYCRLVYETTNLKRVFAVQSCKLTIGKDFDDVMFDLLGIQNKLKP